MQHEIKNIISASRRTDIPAYYSDWLIRRMKLGYTYYPNPFSKKPIYINLKQDSVKAIVFWTRNPRPIFKHLDYIDQKYSKMHYMLFTINGYPEILENRNPKIDYSIECFKYLADRYGNRYVQWRFDPIMITSITPEDYILEKFNYISSRLKGLTKRCYFSFIDLYGKTKRNIQKLESENKIHFFDIPLEKQIALIKKIKIIADSYKINLFACAEDFLLNETGIKKAACIDIDLIGDSAKNLEQEYKHKASRPGCGCFESIDIGYYDSCPHGCIYCYANSQPLKALKNAKTFLKNGFPFDKMKNIYPNHLN